MLRELGDRPSELDLPGPARLRAGSGQVTAEQLTARRAATTILETTSVRSCPDPGTAERRVRPDCGQRINAPFGLGRVSGGSTVPAGRPATQRTDLQVDRPLLVDDLCKTATIKCCTCDQGQPDVPRVACRGCAHTVCMDCSYVDGSTSVCRPLCVHCYEPERQDEVASPQLLPGTGEPMEEASRQWSDSQTRASRTGSETQIAMISRTCNRTNQDIHYNPHHRQPKRKRPRVRTDAESDELRARAQIDSSTDESESTLSIMRSIVKRARGTAETATRTADGQASSFAGIWEAAEDSRDGPSTEEEASPVGSSNGGVEATPPRASTIRGREPAQERREQARERDGRAEDANGLERTPAECTATVAWRPCHLGL